MTRLGSVPLYGRVLLRTGRACSQNRHTYRQIFNELIGDSFDKARQKTIDHRSPGLDHMHSTASKRHVAGVCPGANHTNTDP